MFLEARAALSAQARSSTTSRFSVNLDLHLFTVKSLYMWICADTQL